MPTCGNCDAYVTRDFVRVFGVDGAVAGCPACSTFRALTEGTGSARDGAVDGPWRPPRPDR